MQFIRRLLMILRGYKVGKRVYFGKNVKIFGKNVNIGDDCYFDDNVTIQARNVSIGYNTIIYNNVDIYAISDLKLGCRNKISRNCMFKAFSIDTGHDLWCNENVEVGGGGWRYETATLTIGDFVHIGKNAHINVCQPIKIDGYCGIGMECMLFTHSSGNGQSILEGYQHIEGPIHIAKRASLYSRVIVPPNTKIEEGVIVAANSYLKNGVIEARGFYAGSPAVLKKKMVTPTIDEKFEAIKQILAVKKELDEGTYFSEKYGMNMLISKGKIKGLGNDVECYITLGGFEKKGASKTYIDLNSYHISGIASETTEKLRDEMRRSGIILDFKNYAPKKLDAVLLKNSKIEL